MVMTSWMNRKKCLSFLWLNVVLQVLWVGSDGYYLVHYSGDSWCVYQWSRFVSKVCHRMRAKLIIDCLISNIHTTKPLRVHPDWYNNLKITKWNNVKVSPFRNRYVFSSIVQMIFSARACLLCVANFSDWLLVFGDSLKRETFKIWPKWSLRNQPKPLDY